MHPWRRATAIVAATVAATAVGVSGSVALPAKNADPQPGGSATPRAVPAAGTFYPTDATRLLGSPDSGYAVEPGPGVTVQAAGVASLPSTGVSAVVVNVAGRRRRGGRRRSRSAPSAHRRPPRCWSRRPGPPGRPC